LSGISTRLADAGDLQAVAALFDGYRQFYGNAPDIEGATAFIAARFRSGDSVIIVAESGGQVVGFTQLYPSFTSVGMAPIMILNDLFVAQERRGAGVAEALLEAAGDFARQGGAVRLSLSTQIENQPAQALYEKTGWTRDEQFCVYNLKLTD